MDRGNKKNGNYSETIEDVMSAAHIGIMSEDGVSAECCVTDSVRRRPKGFWRLFLYRAEKKLANDFPTVYSAVVINTVKGCAI